MTQGHRPRPTMPALALADFEVDDILATPGERLMTEAGEDFGDPAALAAAFDAIAAPLLAPAHSRGPGRATAAGAPAAAVGSRRGPAVSPPAVAPLRRAVGTAARRLAAPLGGRTAVAALVTVATLVLVAVLSPALDPLMFKPQPATEAPPLPDDRTSDASMAAPASKPAPAPAATEAPPPSPDSAVPAATAPTVVSAPDPSQPRRAGRAATAAPAAVARPSPAPTDNFVVQLATSRSAARARAAFRTLKSRYPILAGRKPLIEAAGEPPGGDGYAVRVGPFASAEEAERLCADLRAAGADCTVRGH